VPRNVIGSNGGISEYARFAIVSARCSWNRTRSSTRPCPT
jgi:hypothetical protein